MLGGNASRPVVALPVVALLGVLLLGGCGRGDGGTTSSRAGTDTPKTAAGAGGPGCPELVSAVMISSDSDPTAVLRCIDANEHVPGEGEWSVALHERATGPAMLTLLAALRLPSEPRSTGMCTMELRMPTVVRLETASGLVDVATPKESCGHTRSEVIAAYNALSWVEVSRTRGEHLRSEAAVTAGCDPWKDMLAISARDSTPGGPGPLLAPGAKVKVCVYRSVYPVGWTPDGNEAVDGEPEGGSQLPAADVDRVAALLRAAGPAAPCRSAHARFAVVGPGSQPLYVELDGCFRILAPDGSLRQGTKELADLLGPFRARS